MVDTTPSDNNTSYPHEWTDPTDGTVWQTRKASPVSWPRLLHVRIKVTPATQGTPVAGNVRAKKVKLPRLHSRNGAIYQRPVWVYHKEDGEKVAEAPDPVEAFKAADRQLIENGKHKGKWALSPRRVAKEFGMRKTQIARLKKGIPWMPRISKGCRRGKLRKPKLVPLKNGPGRIEDFWPEEEVFEFRDAKKALAAEPPTDLGVTRKQAKKQKRISPVHAWRKQESKEFGEQWTPLARRGKSKKGKEFTFTSHHRLIPPGDLQAYQNARLADPVRSDEIRVKDFALVIGRCEVVIYDWINHGIPFMGNRKLKATKAKIRCAFTRKKKPRSDLRPAWRIDKEMAREVFAHLYPKRPLPKILKTGPATSNGAVDTEISDSLTQPAQPTPSFISSFNSDSSGTDSRGPYKANKHKRVLKRIQRYQNAGNDLKTCIDETAADFELPVGTVKTIYYRNRKAKL
jgi:hypothetical protein